MIPVHRHHSIDYIEFSATDLGSTRRFYEQAFGWSFNEYGPNYLGIQNGQGGEAGGITRSEAVKAGGPLVILYSEDLEDSLRRVVAAGGQVTEEPFAFPGGRRFHFEDPGGNELAVWSPEGGLALDS
jgi:predicted enzyme related to lactoylglutathione lyase